MGGSLLAIPIEVSIFPGEYSIPASHAGTIQSACAKQFVENNTIAANRETPHRGMNRENT